jgi:hypothetical protein
MLDNLFIFEFWVSILAIIGWIWVMTSLGKLFVKIINFLYDAMD